MTRFRSVLFVLIDLLLATVRPLLLFSVAAAWPFLLFPSPAHAQANAFAADFSGKVTYKGRFSGFRLKDGKESKFVGPITIVLAIDKGEIVGRYLPAPGVIRGGHLVGQMRGTECRLYDDPDLMLASCTPDAFDMEVQTGDANHGLRFTVTAKATDIVALAPGTPSAIDAGVSPAASDAHGTAAAPDSGAALALLGLDAVDHDRQFTKMPVTLPETYVGAIQGNWLGTAKCPGGRSAITIEVRIGKPAAFGPWSNTPEAARQREIQFWTFSDNQGRFQSAKYAWSRKISLSSGEFPVQGITVVEIDNTSPASSASGGRRSIGRLVRALKLIGPPENPKLIGYYKDCEATELRRVDALYGEGDIVPGSRPANTYLRSDFTGISTWLDVFQKAVDDPSEFQRFLASMNDSATGTAATANMLVSGPRRNAYHKFSADLQMYLLGGQGFKQLASSASQCNADRNFSAGEACDCLAGFPGDTRIGVGAGELVLSSNVKMALSACTAAVKGEADGSPLRTRYLAQLGRAQTYLPDQSAGGASLREAMAKGYARAQLALAQAGLIYLEGQLSMFPGPSEADIDAMLKSTQEDLAKSRRAGDVREPVVARQVDVLKKVLVLYKKTSSAVVEFMNYTPPKAQCGSDCQSYKLWADRQDRAWDWASSHGRQPYEYKGP